MCAKPESAFFALLTCLTVSSFVVSDPCESSNHATFPVYLGSRNEHCQSPDTGSQPCDMFLTPGWYVTPDATILTQCPSSGDCGVSYPTWMNGTLPDVSDDIVTRPACVKQGIDCCSLRVDIEVKNCSGFYVYNLTRLPECYSVYCFESVLNCEEPTTSTVQPPATTTTQTLKKVSTTPDFTNDNATKIGLAVGLAVTALLLIVAVAVIAKVNMGCSKIANHRDNETDDGKLPTYNDPEFLHGPPPKYECVMAQEKHSGSVVFVTSK